MINMTQLKFVPDADPYDVLYNPDHKPRIAKRANRMGLEDTEYDEMEPFIDYFKD